VLCREHKGGRRFPMVARVRESPHEVLGVVQGAPEVVIRRAYRRLALQHHPDKDESEDATANFQRIQHAYEQLVSPSSRQDDFVDFSADVNCTPLMCACRSHDTAEVERLLSQGEDFTVQNSVGLMAIHYAVGAGCEQLARSGTQAIPILRALLEAKCSPDAETRDGFTALCFAAAYGYVPVVSMLLARNAQPDAGIDKAPSALSLAAEQGHLPIVRMLLENGAEPDVIGSDNCSALGCAVRAGHADIAASLLWAEADPNMKGWDEKSPLLLVAERFGKGAPGMLLMAELLLDTKADAGGIFSDPRTPLMEAAQNNSYRLSDLLINKLRQQASDKYWDESGQAKNRPDSFLGHLCLPITTECSACFAGLTKQLRRE